MVSAAVVHLPAAVSLLLVEALFMQISGVSLALTWPRRLCLLRVLLGTSHCYKLSPLQAHWGRWPCSCLLWLACLFIAHVGSGYSPLSCGVSLPPPLLQAFPLLFAGHVLPLLPSLAWLVYLQFCEGFPSLPLWLQGALPSLLSVFFVVIAYYSVFFLFSLVGGQSVRGLCWSGPGLSVGVLHAD
jgi:hypothetical protein